MIVDAEGNEYFVFDDHTHMGQRPNPRPLASGTGFAAGDMVRDMDASGVDMVVAFPMANPHTDYRAENERVIGYMNEHPDRIVAFARIQPYFMDKAVADVAEFGKRGIKGLKFHPFMDGGGLGVNNRELMFPLMEEASKHRMVVLIHSGESWNSSPSLIGDLAENFPDVRFIVGHSGLIEFHEEAIVAARRTPNLYLDTTETAPPGLIRNLVRAVGADRVHYGSDHPFIPFGFEIGKVAKYAGLNVEELRKILGTNTAALLGITIKEAGRRRVPLSQL